MQPASDLAPESGLPESLMSAMSLASDPAIAAGLAAMGFAAVEPARHRALAAALNHANPFWRPDRIDLVLPALALTLSQFEQSVARAKLAATAARRSSVLVSACDKAVGDWLAGLIATVLDLPVKPLDCALPSPASRAAFGHFQEEEADELAILGQTLEGSFVASQRVRANPYSLRIMAQNGIRSIVLAVDAETWLASLDAEAMAARQAGETPDDGLPAHWHQVPEEDRHMMLVEARGLFAIQHHVSWRQSAPFAAEAVMILPAKHLEPDRLSGRIADFLGLSAGRRARLAGLMATNPPPDPASRRLHPEAALQLARLAGLYHAELANPEIRS